MILASIVQKTESYASLDTSLVIGRYRILILRNLAMFNIRELEEIIVSSLARSYQSNLISAKPLYEKKIRNRHFLSKLFISRS